MYKQHAYISRRLYKALYIGDRKMINEEKDRQPNPYYEIFTDEIISGNYENSDCLLRQERDLVNQAGEGNTQCRDCVWFRPGKPIGLASNYCGIEGGYRWTYEKRVKGQCNENCPKYKVK
jgi:hypothetical protein